MGRVEDASRFALAQLADSWCNNSPTKIRAGCMLGRCHTARGEHSLSAAAYDAALQLATEGRLLTSEASVTAGRALAGIKAGSASAQHWSEREGRQRLAAVVGRMEVGGGEEQAALAASLLPL